jgi:hypothetical protein
VPPGPGRRYGVHFRRPGPGVTPSSSPLAPTLGSTLGQYGAPASQFKCCMRQPSVQFRARRLLVSHSPRLWPSQIHVLPAMQRSRPSAFASPAVGLPTGKTQIALAGGNPCLPNRCCRVAAPFWHGTAKLPAMKVVVAFSAWFRGVAWAGCLFGRGKPNSCGGRPRFSYSWAMQARSAALPNPSVKRSANSASRWPSSAGPAAHFALAVQRATLLATAYLKR